MKNLQHRIEIIQFLQQRFGSKVLAVVLLCSSVLPFEHKKLYGQATMGDIFVSSRNTHSVKRFSSVTGEFLGDFVSPASGGLSSTQEVLFDLNGDLLVTGRNNSAVKRYSGETGSFLGDFTSGYQLDNPTKMTLGPDTLIYVSQWGQQQNKVARFDASTGAFVDEFTEIGLNQGCGHAWDEAGNLYVASFGSRDVRKFDGEGKFLEVFTEGGRLQGAVNVWFGQDGDLFVVDWQPGAVLRFDGQTGAFKSNFITGMSESEGFAIDGDGQIYICDWTQNVVNRYDSTGQFVDRIISSGGLQAPNSITFAPTTVTSVRATDGIGPTDFSLSQNFPNPFNPATQITFELASPTKIELSVFNLTGQKIVTLVDEVQAAGINTIEWRGTDERGNRVSSGVYIYRLSTEQFSESRKMLLLQ